MPELDLHKHGILEAHAGTGKTYAITNLVLDLVSVRGLHLREILLVTYTEKAAQELATRVRKRLTEAAAKAQGAVRAHLEANLREMHEAWIGTIHSACLRILRQFPFESGISFSPELSDDEDGLETALREALRDDTWKGDFQDHRLFSRAWNCRSADSQLQGALALALALVQGSEIHPASLLEASPDPSEEHDAVLCARFQVAWARQAAKLHRAQKVSHGKLSYQDMLGRMVDALERDEFRSLLRDLLKVGIVDEFQDTSPLQWTIFRRLFLDQGSVPPGNLYLVGDPKQSIYSFQGADVHTYLDACQELSRHGALKQPLETNWRTTPDLIEGVNDLLLHPDHKDWFQDNGIRYDRANRAVSPARSAPPHRLPGDLGEAPVRVHPFQGKTGPAKTEYAQQCAAWILGLKGRLASIPEGDQWKDRTLDWGDFAVVVSARNASLPFRRAFDRAGIPWALYKQEGVFRSRAALEVRTVLLGLGGSPSDASRRSMALATRLLAGREDLLEEARHLARNARWARLFRLLSQEGPGPERILSGTSGDREWMDLRQVCQYALEFLASGSGGMEELAERLGRIDQGLEDAPDDRNLMARATDRGRVQILTMHVSKGLEFPVAFLSASGPSNKHEAHSWIDPDSSRRLVMPGCIPNATRNPDKTPLRIAVDDAKAVAKAQKEQETRRLVYVAATRPKLLLVLPCHVKEPGKKPGKEKPHDPLSQLTLPCLEATDRIALLGSAPDPIEAPAPPRTAQEAAGHVHGWQDLSALRLPSRARAQTSFTQVTADNHVAVPETHGLGERLERSEETDAAVVPPPATVPADDWLPRGARTGDCLHEILEGWMSPGEDLSWVHEEETIPARVREASETLSAHGMDIALAPKIVHLLKSVLLKPMALPGGSTLRLCDLATCDRLPEVEFHWPVGANGGPARPTESVRGWMVGYIDLLFRHESKWYVLDWKTTSMALWNAAALDESVRSHGYDLQGKLYGQSIARALKPHESWGGGVVVYLRAFADPATTDHGIWISGADPDSSDLDRRVRTWMESRRSS